MSNEGRCGYCGSQLDKYTTCVTCTEIQEYHCSWCCFDYYTEQKKRGDKIWNEFLTHTKKA